MEMISINEGIVYFIVAVAAIIAGTIVVRHIDKALRFKTGGLVQPESFVLDLDDTRSRDSFEVMLRRIGFTGDADIRQGFVFPPVPPERVGLLAQMLMNAAAFIPAIQNRAADDLYVRTLDGSHRPIGVDLEMLIDAGRAMQRVVEDRKKSRSLYKGITDDEIKAVVRAGMAAYLKDDGSFPEAVEVGKGLWDSRPEFLMAQSVVELLYNTKGVRS